MQPPTISGEDSDEEETSDDGDESSSDEFKEEHIQAEIDVSSPDFAMYDGNTRPVLASLYPHQEEADEAAPDRVYHC